MKGRVLIVAGSDSSGGAGIQADIKTVTMLGGYAATAITALTVQNTEGISGILPVPPDFVRQQIDAVLGDIGADCFKTGMLMTAETVAAVAEALVPFPDLPLVVDPVLVSSSGTALLDPAAVETLTRRLIARAAVLTPNLPEAAVLLGRAVAREDEMIPAAQALRALGARTIVLKGGHLSGPTARDVVVGDDGSYIIESPRLATRHTHGTGCTFASAIATGIAQGLALRAAIARAHDFVHRAIASAPGFGRGHGPLDHTPGLRRHS